jgi:hypothetical protein
MFEQVSMSARRLLWSVVDERQDSPHVKNNPVNDDGDVDQREG